MCCIRTASVTTPVLWGHCEVKPGWFEHKHWDTTNLTPEVDTEWPTVGSICSLETRMERRVSHVSPGWSKATRDCIRILCTAHGLKHVCLFFFFIPVIFHLIFPDWSWPQVTTETATRRASVCFIVDSPRFPKVLATILWVVSISSFLYEFAQAALPLPWTE